jgi:hypothetical protein
MNRGSGSSGSGRRRRYDGRNVSNASNVPNPSIHPAGNTPVPSLAGSAAPGALHGSGGENIDRRIQTSITSRESDTGHRPTSYAEGYQDGYHAGRAADNRRQLLYDPSFLEENQIGASSYYGGYSRGRGTPRAGSRGAPSAGSRGATRAWSRDITRGTTRGGGRYYPLFGNSEGPSTGETSTGETSAGETPFNEGTPEKDAPKDETSVSGSPSSDSSEMMSSWEKIP